MAAKNSFKKKKMQTTLGKAVEVPKNDDVTDPLDLSHLQKPIVTSITGLPDVLSLFHTATTEVKHYLTYECDVMYECRICRTIFRSLANFVLHKRSYCTENYNNTICRSKCQENGCYVLDKTDINSNRSDEPSSAAPDSAPKTKEIKKKNISTVLEKLVKKQEDQKAIEKMALEDLSEENEKEYRVVDERNNVALEKIDSSDVGVFQTMFKNMAEEYANIDSMKTEVMELHGVFSSDEAVLGPNGKIHSFETEKLTAKPHIPKGSLICNICNQKFSTKKTLTYHVKYKHNYTRMVYSCPICNDHFANAWCVFRHLYKIHRKTSVQIRKMRDDIHAKAFRRDQQKPIVEKETQSENTCDDAENQWLENVESDNDLQMCGGCGKRFERKAALHSHSQMCARRIALCNTIKENNMKQAMEEARAQKIAKIKFDNLPKGAEKRKPLVLRKKIDLIETKRDAYPSENKIKEECAEPEICNGDDANDQRLAETVTIEPFDDFEQDCDMLSMEKENFSAFRSSMSPTDVCNIIGVPVTKKQKSISVSNDVTVEKKFDQLTPDDNSSSNCSLAQLFRDDNSKTLYNRLDADIETTLKEISSLHQSPTHGEAGDEPAKRQWSDSAEEPFVKIPRAEQEFKDTTLESKAEKHVDIERSLCLPCDAKFKSTQALMKHMSRHFNWYCYQCRKCSYMSYLEDTCIQHVRKAHALSTNAVLPVPNWKTLKLSTDFVSLSRGNKANENKLESGLKSTANDSEIRKMIMEVIFGSNVDTSNFLDATKKTVPEQEARPVRTRTKSVKVVQDDFLYDFDTSSKKSGKNCDSSSYARKVIKPLKVYTRKGDTNRKDGKGTSLLEKTASCSRETRRTENNKI